MKENEAYMESMEAKLNALKAQFQELVLGNGGLGDFLGSLISIGTGVLKVINTLGGLPTVLMSVLSVILLIKGTQITDAIKNVVSLIPTLISAIQSGTIAYSNGALTIASVNTTLSLSIPIIGAVVAGFTILRMALSGINNSIEEQNKKTEEANNTLIDEIKNLGNLKSQIEDESTSREQLVSIIKNNQLGAYDDEADALKTTTKLRQQAIDKIDEETKKKAEQLKQTGLTKYQKALGEKNNEYSDQLENPLENKDVLSKKLTSSTIAYGTGDTLKDFFNGKDTTKLSANNLDDYISGLQETISNIQELDNSTGKYTSDLESLGNALTSAQDKQKEIQQTTSNYEDAIGSLGLKYDETTGSLSEMNDYEKEIYNSQKDSNEQAEQGTNSLEEEASAVEDLAKSLGMSVDEFTAQQKAMGISSQDFANYKSSMNDIDDAIDSIQSSYETLSGAVSEYNSQGSFSLDTIQSLLSLEPEYLSMLDFENGKLALNKSAIADKIKEQVNEAKQTVYNTAAKRLEALTTESNTTATSNNATVHINSATDWENYAKSVDTATNSLNDNNAKLSYNNALQGAKDSGANKKDIEKIVNETKQQIKVLNSLADGVKGVSTSTDKNTNSTKKNTKAKKKSNDANKKAEKAEKELKNAIDDATDSIDAQKDSLESFTKDIENLYDAIIDAKEKEIDKLDDAQDKTDKQYEDEIDFIEKEQDSIQDLIDEKEKAKNEEVKNLQAQQDAIDDEIESLKKSNEEIQDNIDLREKLENLASAKAKRVMTLKDGVWQYTEDEEAVASARNELNEYVNKKSQDDAISQLEEEKDLIQDKIDYIEISFEKEKESYEQRIEEDDREIQAIKDRQEADDAYYESQKKNIQDYIDNVKELSQSWENMQNQELIFKYLNGDINNIGDLTKLTWKYDMSKGQIENLENLSEKIKNASSISQISFTDQGYSFANGTNSIPKDQFAITGENPYKEIVIGSKLNNGVAMNLPKGSGVVNAKSTNTLAGILNNLSNNIGTNELVSGQSNQESNSFNIQSIQVNANNADEFISSMRNFKMKMTQKSF